MDLRKTELQKLVTKQLSQSPFHLQNPYFGYLNPSLTTIIIVQARKLLRLHLRIVTFPMHDSVYFSNRLVMDLFPYQSSISQKLIFQIQALIYHQILESGYIPKNSILSTYLIHHYSNSRIPRQMIKTSSSISCAPYYCTPRSYKSSRHAIKMQ